MNIEKSNITIIDGAEIGNNTNSETEKNSSFISIRVSKTELERLVLVSTRCREIGLNVGVSSVVKKVYQAGLTLLCLDEAVINPLSLFIEDGGTV